MKILGYQTAHDIQDFDLQEMEMETPIPTENQVLVRLKALSVNPIDYKIRKSRSSEVTHPVILGWDGAGTIEKTGSAVKGFQIGDDVFYAGDLMKSGTYSELQVVDHRIIAKKPKSLSFVSASALPLTSLTAWEALLERGFDYSKNTKVLILGGAGGVGSIAIQILKAKTNATLIASAARPETIEWCLQMGADHVINHSQDIQNEIRKLGFENVDIVFSTTHSNQYIESVPKILRPFGHFVLIDDLDPFDMSAFKWKSLSIHWELMFAKTLHQHGLESQGKILQEMADLVDAKKIKSTLHDTLNGLTAENIQKAHQILESGKTIGKIGIQV